MAVSKQASILRLTLPVLLGAAFCAYGCNLLIDVSGYTQQPRDAGTVDAGPADAGSVDAAPDVPDLPPGALAVKWARWRMPNDPDAGSYTKNGNEVIDGVTGLVWLDPGRTAPTYVGAAAVCAEASAGGARTYRLPTRIELVSLLDFTVTSGLPKVSGGFGALSLGTYWTQSYVLPKGGPEYSFWMVNFATGATEVVIPSGTTKHSVLCVVNAG